MNNIIVPINYDNNSITTDLTSERFLKRREIFISSEITSELAQRVILQLQYLEDKCSDLPIYVLISSPGGCIHSGLAIIDAFNRSQCPIVTIATGMCYSMAAVILAVGRKRYITQFAEVLLHQPLSGTGLAQATEIDIAAKHVLAVRERIYSILAQVTKKSFSEIASVSERDYYLSAEEAVEFGLADSVGFPDFDHDEEY